MRGRKVISLILAVLFFPHPVFTQVYLPFAFPSSSDFLLVRTSEDQNTIGILNSDGQLCFRQSNTGRILGSFCFPPSSVSDFRFYSDTLIYICFLDRNDNSHKVTVLNIETNVFTEFTMSKMDIPLNLQLIENDLIIWGMNSLEFNSKLQKISAVEIHKLSYKSVPSIYPDFNMLKSFVDPEDGGIKSEELYFSLVNLLLRSYSQLEIPAFFSGTILGASETAERKKDLPFYQRLEKMKITVTKSATEIRTYQDPVLPYYNITVPAWSVKKSSGWLTNFSPEEETTLLTFDNASVSWNSQKHNFDVEPLQKTSMGMLSIQGNSLILSDNGSRTEWPSALVGMQPVLSYYFDDKTLTAYILGKSFMGFILRKINKTSMKTDSFFLKTNSVDPILDFNVSTGTDSSLVTINYNSQDGTMLRSVSLIRNDDSSSIELLAPQSSFLIYPDFQSQQFLCFFPADQQKPSRLDIRSFDQPGKSLFVYEYASGELFPVLDFSPQSDIMVIKDSKDQLLVFSYSGFSFKEQIEHPLNLKFSALRLLPSSKILAVLSPSSIILFYDYEKHIPVRLLHLPDKFGFGVYDFEAGQYTWYNNSVNINTPFVQMDANLEFLDLFFTQK